VTWFIAIAGCMTLAALAWILRPLLRRRPATQGVARDQANLALLRDQLAESEAELARGAIAPEQHLRTRADIERRVLEEAMVGSSASDERPAKRGIAVAIAIVIPLAAWLAYLQLGNPGALREGRQELAGHGENAVTPEVEQMVGRLAARLETTPDDADGWALLARSYSTLERFPQAVAAYARAIKLRTDDAALYADYADALAMTREPRFDKDVLALIGRALKIDPDHPKALLLAATAAADRRDFGGAANHLEHLQKQLPPDSDFARMVGQRLAEARAQGAPAKSAPAAQPTAKSAPAAQPASSAGIAGRVELSAAIAAKAAPTDTVFILARAPEGSRMPLAILKRQVKDLPVDFALSDAQAMSPAMKLSSFQEVVIVARVSKSGSAAPQSGDLLGTTPAVKLGAAGVRVVIDSVVP
jgi:cytochrome c-type biogenesis protein CcmH